MANRKTELTQQELFAIGNRLLELRREAGLTQQGAADALENGTHMKTYAAWETGQREPPLWALRRFSQLYGVGVDYILGGGYRAVNGKEICQKTGLSDAAVVTLQRHNLTPPGAVPDRTTCQAATLVSALLVDYEGRGRQSVLELLREYTATQPEVEGAYYPTTGLPAQDLQGARLVNLSAAALVALTRSIEKFRDGLQVSK